MNRDDGRSRSDRPDRERVAKLRADERAYGGHTFQRHVDIGPAGTRERALRILAAHDGAGCHRAGDATRWTSEHALARAVGGVERSPEYRKRLASAEDAIRRGEPPQTVRPVVRVRLADVLGPAWRSGVAGHRADATRVQPTRFGAGAQVVAVYRARPGGGWVLHTCYPVPRAGNP
ncbi:hypothetical protein [Amycolatopsis pithecellobii]|uniref:Bacterial CdiA-CT RNAse A domain-containing protein n=1 Tax=Amycolatopsis pithecellobii TaxID=664692 RepID=A0A6N7YS78_9PSEU|nr:hypothetical protein [Amycolatopsis pithecellobii]MTD54788.1 hypothetical protein [Amycolatopsis pithecellobii]